MKHLLLSLIIFFSAQQIAMAQNSEELSSAVSAWLDDKDEIALPLLSKFANSGDENAMLLLGQIALRPGELSPFLHSKTAKQRNNLMKVSKGKFFRSWHTMIVKNKKLSDALTSGSNANTQLSGIVELLDQGERGQALRVIQKMINHHLPNEEILNIVLRDDFPEQLLAYKFYVLTSLGIDPGSLFNDIIAQTSKNPFSTFAFIGFTKQVFKTITDDLIMLSAAVRKGDNIPGKGTTWATANKFNDAALKVYQSAPELKAINDLCSSLCKGEIPACIRTAYTMLGGYHSLLGIQSPIEKIIPSSNYFKSKRFRADLLRRMDGGLLSYWITKRPKIVNKCIGKQIYAHGLYSQQKFDKVQRAFLGVN